MQDPTLGQTPGLAHLTAELIMPDTDVLSQSLPAMKCVVRGAIGENPNKPATTRAIVFVIDRSGSMYGNRINNIKQALMEFIPPICEDPLLSFHIVLFGTSADPMEIDKDPSSARGQIGSIQASGGTNFHSASLELVRTCKSILKQDPTREITLIMCSDGEVSRDNAVLAHKTWKEFVRTVYRSSSHSDPFVCAIGISRDHSADVLDGFILSDDTGNYVIATEANEIHDAFVRVSQEAVQRQATKLDFTFACGVYRDIYVSDDMCEMHEVIAVGSDVEQVFWVTESELMKCHGDFRVICNGVEIQVVVNRTEDLYEGRCVEIDYYMQVVLGMLGVLRSTQDPLLLRTRAAEIEEQLKELTPILSALHKPSAYGELSRLLDVPPEDITDEVRAQRYELMKKYREISQISTKLRKYMTNLTRTVTSLKDLLREIVFGNVRMQELRQHILNLHFRKKHAKRMNKLIMTEEKLEQRQQLYDGIENLMEDDVKDISDEIGSGCFLSTLSMRDLALESNPLWIVGRVERSGGLAVSNPEMIKIEYISPSPVCNSFFEMAVDVSRTNSFLDTSREQINARLFPLYGNRAHMLATKPYVGEALSHAVTGRNDIDVVDYTSLWATVGRIIATEKPTISSMSLLFHRILPSFHLLCNEAMTNPYKASGRERDRSAPMVSLCQLSAERLRRYTSEVKYRSSSMVSNIQVLFADVLLAYADGNNQFISDMLSNKSFWFSTVLQRIRSMCRATRSSDQQGEDKSLSAERNHDAVLEILVRGIGPAKEESQSDQSLPRVPQKAWNDLFDVVECQECSREEATEWDAQLVTPSQIQMCSQILSRVDFRDLIQARRFFVVLNEIIDERKDPDEIFDEDVLAKFKGISDDCENDVVSFLREIDVSVDFVFWRAICSLGVMTCMNNKKYVGRLDLIEKLVNDPDEAYWVLGDIHENFIIPALAKKHFWPQEENHWRKYLTLRQKMDVWTGEEWSKATIMELDEGRLRIRFDMYRDDPNHDVWLDRMESTRIAPLYSHVDPDDDDLDFTYWNDEIRRRVLVAQEAGYAIHLYRESNIPNRHGHCNSNPYLGGFFVG